MTPQANMLPPIPQPPHDPTSWLLDSRTGWRAAKSDAISLQDTLELIIAPASQRVLTEESGSFGGLTIPGNMAVGPGGSIYLLDSLTPQLKVFDACDCAFKPVPCFSGIGSKPRQLRNPHGIGICSGNLFICDTDNHRLSVFALRGFILRRHWAPPTSAYEGLNPKLANQWTPYELAFDQHGDVYVTDPANGGVHRFSPSGQWREFFTGVGLATWITIDCRNRIYVIADGPKPSVRVLNEDATVTDIESSAAEVSRFFPKVPFLIDAGGLLHLGPFCSQVTPNKCEEPPGKMKCPPQQPLERGVFDLGGNEVIRCSTPTLTSYVEIGTYLSEALDSELYRCQWHRVILRGSIPAGSTVMVSTFSAEALLTDDQILNPDEVYWETNQVAKKTDNNEWDCLIRSGGGRYLWLKLELQSNGKVTPRLESIEIEFPRVSLRRYLPAVFGEEPVSADFTDRFLGLFDTTIRSVEIKLDQLARYFDPSSTPAQVDPKTGADFLSWLGSWIGVSIDRHWPESKRRRFLKQAASLFDLRGTREGLWRELLVLLEMEPGKCCEEGPSRNCCPISSDPCSPVETPRCTWQAPPLILEHFKLRRWLFLGAGRIGDQAVLWGKRIVNRSQLDAGAQVGHTQLLTTQDPYRDPFHYYSHKFTVFVPACYRDSESLRKSLENLLRTSRPATALAQIEYVSPRFRIGFQSMIGFDSVIARYPAGITLNETPLGRASVLESPPHKQGGPSMEIGNQSRIGATTTLD
jgi:phage tail-like protein